jgi:hypothetical protein
VIRLDARSTVALAGLLVAACSSGKRGADGGVDAPAEASTSADAPAVADGPDGPAPDHGAAPDGDGAPDDGAAAGGDASCDAALASDPSNCGACGHVCQLFAAFAKCTSGRCEIESCGFGYQDLDKLPETGCEYPCAITNGGVEVCDGLDNDCNGTVDDGFDLAHDVGNCGACGHACTYPHATALCSDRLCARGACDPGYFDLDGNPDNGCEYHCPNLVPKAETCNGIDDDCNGVVDDNPTDVGGPCGSSVGTCRAGTTACVHGATVCAGFVGPSPEVCDGLDNDCNGVVDDGFGYPLYNVDAANCGACGAACGLPHATAGCASDPAIDPSGRGVCKALECDPGFAYAPSPCSGGPPGPRDGPQGIGCYYSCPVVPLSTETCDGQDNDCNGCVDDGLTPPAGLCSTLGVCAGRTIPVRCGGAAGWRCDYSGVPGIDLDAAGNLRATETVCDGLDNNCNGTPDRDGFSNLGAACSAGVGACARSGTIVCAASKTAAVCSATPNPAAATDEKCNGIDDNCDGQIDERAPAAGTVCLVGGVPVACKGLIDPMVRVSSSTWVYQYEASRLDATSSSPGGRSDRACSKPGVLPWAEVTQAQAAAACAAVLSSAGTPMRLCTAAEWQASCQGPSAATWSFSATPNTYLAQVCNDVNLSAATPAAWPTGTVSATATGNNKFCYTDWASAGRLVDMSGNVAEWTSTPASTSGATLYDIRGGSFSSAPNATACAASADLAPADFASPTLGFRCCSDAAP